MLFLSHWLKFCRWVPCYFVYLLSCKKFLKILQYFSLSYPAFKMLATRYRLAAFLERAQAKSVSVCLNAGVGFSLVQLAEGQWSPGEEAPWRPRLLRFLSLQTPNGSVATVHHDLPEVQSHKDRRNVQQLWNKCRLSGLQMVTSRQFQISAKMCLKPVNIALTFGCCLTFKTHTTCPLATVSKP